MSLQKSFWFLFSFTCLALACDTKTKTVDSCGDGFVDPGEQCDGASLGGQSCATLGHYNTAGALGCTGQCRFETTACGGVCGDAVVDGLEGEQCDGGALNDQSCVTLGFVSGALGCGADCRFDVTACQSLCGNGLKDPTESCDDGNAQSGDGCSNTCSPEAGWSCTANNPSVCTPVCGDAQIVGAETCDGTELNGQSCVTQGFGGGTLACDETCTALVTTGCTMCGNDVIDAPEVCDGAALGGQTCITQGFAGGTLACRADCTGFDTTPCQSILNLITVPGGTFQRDDTPGNTSTVTGFQISATEITRAQFSRVLVTDPSDVTYSSGVNDPVQMANWYHAIAFCNKLSLSEGRTPVYTVSGVNFITLTYAQIPTSDNATWNAAAANWSANGYRLPTDMEWMWAAMGATDSRWKAFAGSTGANLIGDYAVFGYSTTDTGRTTTQRTNPAGSKLANELGLYDMSGNVWEWTWDWHGTYPTGTLTDYRGPASGADRVVRGGNWYYGASYCTVAYRNNYQPNYRVNSTGFRVVRP